MSVTQQIVIVDDDDLHLKLLRGIADEVHDVTVYAFTSSQEAIEWIPGQDIDCFVFDYNMPSPDGLEMIASCARWPRSPACLYHVTRIQGAMEATARSTRCDHFVTKPVDRRG